MIKELSTLEKIKDPNISDKDLREILGFSVENTLFVTDLPFPINYGDVELYFNEIGKTTGIKIFKDKK